MERMPSGARSAHLRMPSSTPLTIQLRSQRRPPSNSRGLFGNRCTSCMEGRSSFHRSSETRQLSAPRSTAIEARVSFGFIGLPGAFFIGSSLSQKRLGQSAVHRNDMACCAWCQRAGEEQYRLRAVLWIDRHVSERALRVEASELVAKLIVRLGFIEGNVVLAERSLHAIAREHGRALHNGRRADAVDAYLGRVRHCKLAHQMAQRSLRDVVRLGAALCDDCICGAGEDDTSVDALRLENGE